MSEGIILGRENGPQLAVNNGKTDIYIPGLSGYTGTASGAGVESLSIPTKMLNSIAGSTVALIPNISYRGKDTTRREAQDFGIIGIIIPDSTDEEVMLICTQGAGGKKAWVQHPNIGCEWKDGAGRTPAQALLEMYNDSILTEVPASSIP